MKGDPTVYEALSESEWGTSCALVAALIPRLTWRENGLGLLQGYAVEGSVQELRVHIWSPTLERDGMRRNGNIHDHRFDMVSSVLLGAVNHRWVDPVSSEKGDLQMCEVVHAREAHAEKGTYYSVVIPVPGRFSDASYPITKKLLSGVGSVPSGVRYKFPAGEFHESSSDQLTVTLVKKAAQSSGVRARIMWPYGSDLVHAFGGPSSGDSTFVLEDAHEQLLKRWKELSS